ncbi:MAG: hypothetical protein HYR91_07150 [Flavobacteriia bacterium]|nr:hypothetical protein [Flavobacteriia bacterium]
MKYCLSIILIFFTGLTIAQYSNFNTQRNWSLNKREVRFGAGASQFLSDLGGRNKIGTDYRPWDIDWPSTGYGVEVGYRYRFHPYWATTTSFHYAIFKASDAYTTEYFRHNRNLSVKTTAFELSQRFDYIFLANEKVGKRYNIPGLKGLRDHNDQMYAFVGIGVLAYIPKAQYQGSWHKLRPLHTEGQGMPGGVPEYGLCTITVPFGIGARIGISRMWRLGIEVSYVKTFSDYLDDVHGVYYDKNFLLDPAAKYLSNPAIGNYASYDTGLQRGDIQNDAYFYTNIVLTRNVTYKNYHRHIKKMKFRKGRYKF